MMYSRYDHKIYYDYGYSDEVLSTGWEFMMNIYLVLLYIYIYIYCIYIYMYTLGYI